MTQQTGERLARFLAHAGISSRRHAEELIASGRVQVNGFAVTSHGARIDPELDEIRVDGTPVPPITKKIYLLLHKPVGYVSTVSDPQGRSTVLDLLPDKLRRLRVYPVGRLDRDTSGLLLMTNDGEFALRMTHPRYSTQKHYQALVQGCPSETTLEKLRQGITITDGNGNSHLTAPAQVQLLRRTGTDCWLTLTIHEGRKRQVRRMLSTVGHPVLQLIRIAIGPLTLGDLPTGSWRSLTNEEVRMLLKQS
jgi:23S rRNA pseudouridine2605 synthase